MPFSEGTRNRLLLLQVLLAVTWGTGLSFAQGSDAPAAQTAEDSDVYQRDFFDRFAPQTAFDLVTRVPGFTISGGADLRGFGGGAGNVLIDGERPTIKEGGVEEFLRRIPADSVERIEITRGAQRAGETAGQSIIANIVRKPQSVGGTWSAELEQNGDSPVYPRAEISITAPVGGWQTTTRLNAFWEQFTFTDFDRQRFDGDGNLRLFEEETLPSTLQEAFIASEAKRPLAGGTLTLNGRFGNSKFYQETVRDGFIARLPDGNPDRRTDIQFDSEFWTGEFSGDWTRTVADDWSVKLLGLGSYTNAWQSSSDFVRQPLDAAPSISRFQADRHPLELLSRATYGRVDGTWRPEFGVEIAYNRLDSKIALEREDAGGITPIDLPASDVAVEELRGEAFVNLTWVAAPKWTVEVGLAAETSDITVTGDADNESSFSFVKPSFALTHQYSEQLQFRLAARRTVGQLDFNDFAASANAEDDRFLGGNPDLGPDQTTRLSFTTDYRASAGAALNLEVFHEWRDDVLEQIILPSGAFGVANAGSARVWGLDADVSLPLHAIIPGGLLEAEIELRESEFDDPITGAARNITDFETPNIDVDFRQDLPELRLAWGIKYEPQIDIEDFFVDEESFEARGDRWTAFIETTRFFGVKSQLEIRNIGGQDFPRQRRFFSPDRGGTFDGSENIDRQRGAFIKFTLSDQF